MENTKNENNNDSREWIYWVVILILAAGNVWFYIEKSSTDIKIVQQERLIISTNVEKEQLSTELEQVKQAYEKIRLDNTGLLGKLKQKDNEILQKTAEIKKLIEAGSTEDLMLARTELQNLKNLNYNYSIKIDSLRKHNDRLSTSNTTLSNNLHEEKQINEALSTTNDALSKKVKAGSILKLINVEVKGYHIKGNGKEIESTRAERVNVLKTCMRVLANPVVDRGPLDIFVRIVGPEGVTMANGLYYISYNGLSVPYTAKQTLKYDNEDVDVCITWKPEINLNAGFYKLEVYSNNHQIAFEKFRLD